MSGRRIRTPDQRLRVFVSSTLGELAQERATVRDAVEQLRLTPIMFELGARPHPPQALYRSYLEQSDVFVGIYWQSYGWVAPDMEISGLEDEYVRSAGLPRLVYVKRPAPDIQPRLAELLGRVKDEDTTSYKSFRDAAELHDLLLDDLAVLLAERFDAVDEERTTALPPVDVPTNLPVLPSSFIGREELREQVRGLLRSGEVRLVTLTGPGGAGKTRLALEVAAELVPDFPDGVFFVDLSAEHEPEAVFAAIVRAVPLPGRTEDAPREALERGLRHVRMLLVLDNFEQVTDAGTGVSELLQHCPHLTVLVTSREALRVRGERRLAVPPLSLPEQETLAEARASEAVRLFVDRAAAQAPGFALTGDTVTDVVAVCALLDGLPLAIELAAARVNLFAVGELRARLEMRLDVLRDGPRDLPERQRTLRRTIEWSTELLHDGDRAVLAVLSVFQGARIADVEAVVERVPSLGDFDVVDCLGSLVDKNLVLSTVAGDGRPRLAMLRTIRGYAAEQLEPDRAAAVRRAHAEHYTELARGWQGCFGPAARDDVLATLSVELGNLRAAWSYWVREGDVARLNDLLETLWGYFDLQGNYREAVELGNDLLGVLALQPETAERIRDEIAVETSLARSMIAVRGYTAEVERAIRQAIDRSDAVDHARQRFSVLRSLATLHILRADMASSAEVGRELLALAEKEREPALLADAHLVLGVTAMGRDMTESLAHFDESIAQFAAQRTARVQFRVGPSPGVVAQLISGLLLWRTGFPDRAWLRIDRGVELAAQIGHPYSAAYAAFHGSLAALWQQDLVQLTGRAEELLRTAEAHDYPIWRALAFILRGTAWIRSGRTDDGLAEVERGFILYEGLSTPPVFWGELLSIRAAGCLAAGRLARAADLVEEAAAAEWAGDPAEVDLEILRGDLLLAVPSPDHAAADAAYERAAAMAGERGARIGHLVAATRLAELRRGTPRADEARAAVREAYGTFTEGFGIPQLVAARAVLDGV